MSARRLAIGPLVLLLLGLGFVTPTHAQTTDRRLDDLEDLVKQLGRDRDEANNDIRELQAENERLSDRLDELEDSGSELKKALDKLKGYYEGIKGATEKVADAVKKAKSAIQKLDDAVDGYMDGGWKGQAERLLKEKQDSIKRRLDALEEQTKRIKPLDKVQDQIIKDLGAIGKDLKAFKDSVGKKDKRLAKELAADQGFAKRLAESLSKSGLVKILAEKLPQEKAFLGAILRNSDFQKSLAFNLTKNHLKYFTVALLKDDTFQKGVEHHLTKSERYVKAFAVASLKVSTLVDGLVDGLVGHDKFRKRMGQELAKPDYLRPIAEQLARNDRFVNGLCESSAFTSKLAKSGRFVDALVGNSTFVSKLKPKVQR